MLTPRADDAAAARPPGSATSWGNVRLFEGLTILIYVPDLSPNWNQSDFE